ncbi:Rid family detoxifying hydrolase [bacterium]|jgi:2-iminobutanoate/2-iminopropanoate deaminase|nr:Rid family detoxifying hydrolase [bacterium]|tara:strand:- start:15 stop:452 length:438 start_codon:yes stop_codon:yes gene_type:complete
MNKKLVFVLALFISSCGQVETKKVISTDKAPAAIGPYSQAIQVNNTLYLAGQIALDPTTRKIVSGGIKEQTIRVMENLGAVLNEAGFNFEDVVQSQVFIADMDDYKAMNEVYTEYFKNAPPARAAVQTVLFPGALIEIIMIAQKP